MATALAKLSPAPVEIPLGEVVYDKPVSYYQRVIAAMPSARGFDPRHVEGYMRLQHDILQWQEARVDVRLRREHVECSARNFLVFQRVEERGFVDN